MKKEFPKIKKDIKDFLTEEDGQISKKSIIQTGLALIMLSFSVAEKASALGHTSYGVHNSSSPTYPHCSHGSHGSHGSHSSGCGGFFGSKGCW